MSINNFAPIINNFNISGIYPNPFNPSVSIDFNLSHHSMVNIGIYNVKGQLVENLLHEKVDQGNHKLHWNAEKFGCGFYIVNFNTEFGSVSQKITLIK